MPVSPERLEARRRHLVRTAEDLIRERAGADFTMAELAARAGVSPATPYNLIGTRSDVLNRVVDAEFEKFTQRIAKRRLAAGLTGLLEAVDEMTAQYLADPAFYRGLFRALYGEVTPGLHGPMHDRGLDLWSGLVGAAVASGELLPVVPVPALTQALIGLLGATTFEWSTDRLTRAEYSRAMPTAARIVAASCAAPKALKQLRAELEMLGGKAPA